MKVFERIGQIRMPHKALDNQKVGTLLKVMCGKRVPESMGSDYRFSDLL